MKKKTSVRNFMKDRHRLETPRISNKIFLSLRFYEKSILENLGVLRLPFIAIFVLQPSISAKYIKNQNSELLNVLTMADCDLLKSPI